MLIDLPDDVEGELAASITDLEAAEVAKTQEALVRELPEIPEWRDRNEARRDVGRNSLKGSGLVALWEGEIRCTSTEHDSIYNEPGHHAGG